MRATGIDAVVVALCADYRRRAEVIRAKSASYRVDMEYRYLNFNIMDAVLGLCDEWEALTLIDEIGGEVGYAKSRLEHYSELSYKTLKRRAKDSIAAALHLK